MTQVRKIGAVVNQVISRPLKIVRIVEIKKTDVMQESKEGKYIVGEQPNIVEGQLPGQEKEDGLGSKDQSQGRQGRRGYVEASVSSRLSMRGKKSLD